MQTRSNRISTLLSIMLVILLAGPLTAQTNARQEKFQKLPLGAIKPAGWIKEQMQKDMAGFVGNLDQLVPSLINDPIYGEGRLHKHSKAKDLGNLKSGDAAGDDQYQWWNSETQSNWWDGYIRNAFLLNDSSAIEKSRKHVQAILATQDSDGYLGIYDRELRYHFSAENGELWSKTTLYRGLLAYYECTKDPKTWLALVRAVDNVMQNYPVNQSDPFYAGTGFSGGVAHGLTFTDVLDKMFQLTGNAKYREYAVFLYRNFSQNLNSEKDVQLPNILNPEYKLQCHGVHTYEHLRPLILAAYASGSKELSNALDIYESRIKHVTTLTGAAIGDEWIGGRTASSSSTGYEYCSLHELMDSYTVLFQKSGAHANGDVVENIFYNAAQGSRDPDHSCIAYLKTDNSYEMLGTKNGEAEPGRNQTRYKYSPVHQDVAVCCSPNAGRITPYFIQSTWMKEKDSVLVAALLAPTIVNTSIKNIPIQIEERTAYPYQQQFSFIIKADRSVQFTLKIRKPDWTTAIQTKEHYKLEQGFIVIRRKFSQNDKIDIKLITRVMVKEDMEHEKYFSYGPLVYAMPIKARAQMGRVYLPGFEDWMYTPVSKTHYDYVQNNAAHYSNGKILLQLKNTGTKKIEKTTLVPFGTTILRQVSFK